MLRIFFHNQQQQRREMFPMRFTIPPIHWPANDAYQTRVSGKAKSAGSVLTFHPNTTGLRPSALASYSATPASDFRALSSSSVRLMKWLRDRPPPASASSGLMSPARAMPASRKMAQTGPQHAKGRDSHQYQMDLMELLKTADKN